MRLASRPRPPACRETAMILDPQNYRFNEPSGKTEVVADKFGGGRALVDKGWVKRRIGSFQSTRGDVVPGHPTIVDGQFNRMNPGSAT